MAEIATPDSKSVLDEIRSALKLVVVAIGIIALLALHTFDNLRERPAWDDLVAWLTVRQTAQSLFKDMPGDYQREFYTFPECHEKFALYRTKDPEGLLDYKGCPIEGVLFAGPGLFRGHRLDKIVVDTIYPERMQLQLLLYTNRTGSAFILPQGENDTLFSGMKFRIFDPLFIKYTDTPTPDPTPVTALPLHRYVIARRSEPQDEYITLRKKSWRHYLIMENPPGLRIDPDDDKPWLWDQSRMLLAKAGIDPNPAKISLSDPMILRSLSAAYGDPSEVELAGIHLPARLFLQSFNIILIVILIGATSAVRQLEAVKSTASTWMFSAPYENGILGTGTEVAAWLFGLVVTAAPLFCFTMQISMQLWDNSILGWLMFGTNFVSAVVSSVVLFRLFMNLGRLRGLIVVPM